MSNKIILIGSFFLFSSMAMAATDTEKNPGQTQERYEQLSLFNKVLYFVEQNYVEEVKGKDLIQGAIRGMLETLDPHSNFLTAEVYKDMKVDTEGKFGGIGIEIGTKDNVLTVIAPIDDTPAAKAGIKAGDRIIKIAGESTKGLNLAEAISKMRGKKGTDVKMTIWREGFEKPRDYTITRAEIKVQSVKNEDLEKGYLYLRLTSFNEHAAHDLKKVMDRYEESSGPMKGVIFDLRNNPGGLLDQAVEVSSLFIDDGVVVSTRGRTKDTQDVKYARKGNARKYMPVAVLVNGASASASEIVAGALQDHKRAVILGQPTFGKGSVQTVVEIAPDTGLKLTIARYYTPSGKSIQLKGIQPDVLLDDLDQKVIDEAMRKQEFVHERDLKRRMSNDTEEDKDFKLEELIALDKDKDASSEKEDKKQAKKDEWKPVKPKDDYQVKQALNYLKSFQMLRALKWGDSVSENTQNRAAAK